MKPEQDESNCELRIVNCEFLSRCFCVVVTSRLLTTAVPFTVSPFSRMRWEKRPFATPISRTPQLV